MGLGLLPISQSQSKFLHAVVIEIIMLYVGEWWNRNVFDLARKAFLAGTLVDPADAYTINGKPGDLHKCSSSGSRKPSTTRDSLFDR